jgi:hypothetical protein
MGRCISKIVEHEGIFKDKVRLIVVPDDCYDIDNLKGDCYNPVVNPDIPAERLEAEEREFEEKVGAEGVYGIVGQYKCPCCGSWEDADAVWGFVGDDWSGSGYDADVIISAEKALTDKITDLREQFSN